MSTTTETPTTAEINTNDQGQEETQALKSANPPDQCDVLITKPHTSEITQRGTDDAKLTHAASREASLRIQAISNEPPPIDKKTLMGLIAVYFSVFLDNMGVSIVQPVLPFYAEKFNASSFELGALYSSYSLMATFASLGMGKASDTVLFNFTVFLFVFFCSISL